MHGKTGVQGPGKATVQCTGLCFHTEAGRVAVSAHTVLVPRGLRKMEVRVQRRKCLSFISLNSKPNLCRCVWLGRKTVVEVKEGVSLGKLRGRTLNFYFCALVC